MYVCMCTYKCKYVNICMMSSGPWVRYAQMTVRTAHTVIPAGSCLIEINARSFQRADNLGNQKADILFEITEAEIAMLNERTNRLVTAYHLRTPTTGIISRYIYETNIHIDHII